VGVVGPVELAGGDDDLPRKHRLAAQGLERPPEGVAEGKPQKAPHRAIDEVHRLLSFVRRPTVQSPAPPSSAAPRKAYGAAIVAGRGIRKCRREFEDLPRRAAGVSGLPPPRQVVRGQRRRTDEQWSISDALRLIADVRAVEPLVALASSPFAGVRRNVAMGSAWRWSTTLIPMAYRP
jgi:hypothetical protein